MAKSNLMETATELKEGVGTLLDRLGRSQSRVTELLDAVKQAERGMLEKEELARRALAEQQRAERLREMLASDKDLAVHVGGDDDEHESFDMPEAKAEPAPKQAEPTAEKQAAPSEQPAASASAPAAEPVSAPVAAAAEAEQAQKPAPAAGARPVVQQPSAQPQQPRPQPRQTAGGYQAHPIDNRQGGYQQRSAGQGGYQQRPAGQGGYQQRPAGQGGYQQRPAGQGGYQQRPAGQGGYQQRPAGQGGYQQRPMGQGGYQQRPAGQGGYQQRPMGQGGFQRPAAAAPTTAGKERVSNYDPNKSAYTRNYEAEKQRAKNKKAMAREAAPSASNWDDDTVSGGRRPKRGKQQIMRRPEPIIIEKAVITTETITVKDLSEKIGKPAAEIIKKLFLLGIMATINQEIDFDTCELSASEFGIQLELKLAKSFEEVLTDTADDVDAPELLVDRSPVVTIMGHVDHGKTSLLDAIRNSSVTEGEAGGITQHIGAYTVQCKGRTITFIDTPGHEAFTSMRARGAQVTDIVILVVAADDGIMPQTVEAINHAKAAKVPIVVAINKMDREQADPDRVKQQLTEYELVGEEWGGETIIVPVSAKTRMGLDNLLEMVLLQADILELKANPNRSAKGTIIEAKLDKGRGPIATVLVQNGTLHRGDMIVAGTAYGRVRAMMDDRGRMVNAAGPSMPVEVLGFSEVPDAGDVLNVAEVDKLSRQVAEERRDKIKAEQLKNRSMVSLDDLFNQMADGDIKDLNIIVKADVQGSVEAVKQALEKLSNEEVRVKCIHGGVGAITGSDIMFASASNAIVIGFNVRPDATARAAAEKESVDVRTYRIIYNAIEDVQNAMKGMFKPVFKETELGRATVRETFKVSGVGTIAGSYVNDGKITRSAQIRVVRDGVVVHEGKIASLKRFKDDAKEVLSGFECGIGIDGFDDVRQGDVFEAFFMEEVKR